MNDGFFLERTGSLAILRSMIERTERANRLTVCSFAMSEIYVRRLLLLREQIDYLVIYLDSTLASRHREVMMFIEEISDELYIVHSHAKFILIENYDCRESLFCVTSANATMNLRFECGYVSSSASEIDKARLMIEDMRLASTKL
jgi:hypothetical protein